MSSDKMRVRLGDDYYEVAVSFVPVGMTRCWSVWIAPDGTWIEGVGRTSAEAEADARARWQRWRGRLPLAIDGHAYRQRTRNRVKRRRRR